MLKAIGYLLLAPLVLYVAIILGGIVLSALLSIVGFVLQLALYLIVPFIVVAIVVNALF